MPTNIHSTELVWPGKYDDDGNLNPITRVNLPFQIIEQVNVTRATREQREEALAGHIGTLFDYWHADESHQADTSNGWRNKLIWGDNLYVMSSLLSSFAGHIDVVYIDPPYAVGADFSIKTEIGDCEIRKEQSAIEEKAYRDTWGRGADSYLRMMYERLVLIRELLAETGSLFLHCDWHMGHYLKVVADEVFGRDNLRNEIAWCYTGPGSPGMQQFNRKHDTIFWYSKSASWIFNDQAIRVAHDPKTIENFKKGLAGSGFDLEDYELNAQGKIPEDWWQMAIAARFPIDGVKRTGYANEKPWRLIERILLATTDESHDFVADFFAGSGTTLAVAELLGRRWIGCDLSRFGIHITRKRLLGIQNCRPFELLNLGKYERQVWQGISFSKEKQPQQMLVFEYLKFILELYGAQPLAGTQHLHGKKGHAVVHVGSVDAPVTIDQINVSLAECIAMAQKELHVLGWEWEMGLDLMIDEAARQGIKLLLLTIPREVMEAQAVDRGDIHFYELAHLDAEVHTEGNLVSVELTDFMIPNLDLVPHEVRDKVQKWSDYVDYWAIDWDFQNDTFVNQWQSYRTRQDRSLSLISDTHTYEQPGTYRILVKVIDIFGNDTSRLFAVEVA